MSRCQASGFTLIELVVIMVIISAGLAGIAGLFGQNTRSLGGIESLQQAAQAAQACGDHIMSLRRHGGYSATNSTNLCSNVSVPSGITVTIATPTIDTTAACPTGSNCRDLTITASGSGQTATVTLMLVDY